MAATKPEILSVHPVAQSRLFSIENIHLRFSNGQERHFERLKSRVADAVMVVAQDQGDLILIREYGVGVEGYTLGFPKGVVDAGESSEQAANRELQEEAGYAARRLQVATVFSMNPGYTNMKTHVVLANDLYPAVLPGDEPEPLEVVRWPVARWRELLKHPEFTEARSIAALLWCLPE